MRYASLTTSQLNRGPECQEKNQKTDTGLGREGLGRKEDSGLSLACASGGMTTARVSLWPAQGSSLHAAGRGSPSPQGSGDKTHSQPIASASPRVPVGGAGVARRAPRSPGTDHMQGREWVGVTGREGRGSMLGGGQPWGWTELSLSSSTQAGCRSAVGAPPPPSRSLGRVWEGWSRGWGAVQGSLSSEVRL